MTNEIGSPPDIIDVLAAMNQFRMIEDRNPEFFERHFHSIMFGTAAIHWWNHCEDVWLAFGVAAESDLAGGSELLHKALAAFPLSDEKRARAERQFDLCMPALYRVAKDPELPAWLLPAKAVIDSCFEPE